MSEDRGDDFAPAPTLECRVTMDDGAELAVFVYSPEGVTDVPGTPFAVTQDTPPVLMLHGNGEDHHDFDLVIGPIASSASVICFDARGQGESTRGTEPLTYELLAHDAFEVLSRLGVTRAHVMGFSDGGIEALIMATTLPLRVASLTCMGANLFPEALTKEAALGIGVTERLCRHAADHDPAAAQEAELMRLMLEQPHIDPASLAGISCPTWVMCGSDDVVVPEHSRLIADSIQNADVYVVQGAGHSLPQDAPDQVIECFVDAAQEAEDAMARRHARRHAEKPDVVVCPVDASFGPALEAMYDHVVDDPAATGSGWRRGFWPIPGAAAAYAAAGKTLAAFSAADMRDGSPVAGARPLGAVSVDHDLGDDVDETQADWDKLPEADILVPHLLAVDPDARGRGVARALLDTVVSEARALGCKRVRLNTSPENVATFDLYHGYGLTLRKPIHIPYEGLPLSSWSALWELDVTDIPEEDL